MKSHISSRWITFGNTFQRVVSNALLPVEWSISVNDLCNKSSNSNSDLNQVIFLNFLFPNTQNIFKRIYFWLIRYSWILLMHAYE